MTSAPPASSSLSAMAPAPLPARRLFVGMLRVAVELARYRGHRLEEPFYDGFLSAGVWCSRCSQGGNVTLSVDDEPLTGRLFSVKCGPPPSQPMDQRETSALISNYPTPPPDPINRVRTRPNARRAPTHG